MALNEFDYRIRQTLWFEVSTTLRLQRWGSDVSLYANKDFETPSREGCSALLDALLREIRLNTSGVESIRVTPYSIEFRGQALTRDRVESMFLTAARCAGLKANALTPATS